MEWYWIVIIGLIILLIIVASKKMKSGEFGEIRNDSRYRQKIYSNINPNFKIQFQKLINNIDEINKLINTFEINKSNIQISAIKSINAKIDETERAIQSYWISQNYKKDFAFYISLHYSSHLLGNAIYSEKQKIVSLFVILKEKQNQLSKQIDISKNNKSLSSNSNQLYQQHKSISETC